MSFVQRFWGEIPQLKGFMDKWTKFVTHLELLFLKESLSLIKLESPWKWYILYQCILKQNHPWDFHFWGFHFLYAMEGYIIFIDFLKMRTPRVFHFGGFYIWVFCFSYPIEGYTYSDTSQKIKSPGKFCFGSLIFHGFKTTWGVILGA